MLPRLVTRCICQGSNVLRKNCIGQLASVRHGSSKRLPKFETESLDHPTPSTSSDQCTANVTIDKFDDELAEIGEDFDEVAENVMEAVRRIDKDGEMFGLDFVRDPLNEPDISQMETGEESASRPINRFREVVYTEGELDNSDLSKPPSRDNPHPFDTNTLPPTHAKTLAAYVNHLPLLQRLIDLGMDLLQVELTTNVGRALIRLDWAKDVKPKIFWLVKVVGVDANDVGDYLTRNPFFLVQDLDALKERVGYLYSKNFKKSAVLKIILHSRYYLNNDVKIIDARLGWIQRQFRLRGNEVRELFEKEPKITAFGLGPIQKVLFTLNKELGFTSAQLKEMFVKDPRIFMCNTRIIKATFHYLTKVMQLSLQQIAAFPVSLRCSVSDLRCRHEFLHRLRRAQYHPDVEDYVSLEALLHPSDAFFATNVARASLEDYNKFLKLL